MSAAGDHPGGGSGPGSSSADIERIIERGLQLYATGDVDAALAMWEQALALDPDDVRAAAYVDYVRDNYAMLSSGARSEEEVPFGLGAVPGDPVDDYEVEVTTGGTPVHQGLPAAPVERYIETIDEGWFLDEELPAGFTFDEPPAPPPETLAPRDLDADLVSRPSRQLPLPANPTELSIEMEADEPDDSIGLDLDEPSFDTPIAPSPPGDEDDQTGDFGLGNRWAQAAGAAPPAPDFTDQKSAMPTQEIAAPRGFIRSRLTPVASAAESAEGLAAAGSAAAAADDDDDDRLLTRPGRITGAGPLEPTGEVPRGLGPAVLSTLGGEFGGGTGTGHGGRPIGPDERTRELPQVRVTFNPDTQDLPAPPDLEIGELADLPPVLRLDPQFVRAGTDDVEERTTERNAARFDTLNEKTTERAPAGRYTTPAPIDEPPGDVSGRHPPLVIVEDPVLHEGATEPGARDPREESTADGASRRIKPPTPAPPTPADQPSDISGEYDLHPGTARVRRIASTQMSSAQASPSSLDEVAAGLEAALTAAAPPAEAKPDRTRRRVGELMDRAVAASGAGDHATAIVALDLALKEDPESAVAQKLIHRHQPAILDVYQRFLGDLSARPILAMPMHELSDQKLDIRAAFLLSRIDGALTFEEILDVSGMARGEAFRHLSMLLLRGILEVR